jgi:hypothetical protein
VLVCDGSQKQPFTQLDKEKSGNTGEHTILMRSVLAVGFVWWLVFVRFSAISFTVKEMLKVCTGLGSLKVWSCERNVTFTF